MGLATYTATWAAIGFGIRCYQLGVMQRPLFTSSVVTFLSVYYLTLVLPIESFFLSDCRLDISE
ncbi:hypothetical protein PGT21_004136 [Puccinia graminis f. sp. tritici]|uniref:Uncharacterized protein n=1 Tax=Puccinia graminis f. sp. tritici TaxID=56615 RepID=A0A5B0MEK0_PUCGR|nr:hypothetical protein PGT21_004136 [Puccinia graminis f. sp. tritici]